jgi:hypothetical protein
MSVKIPIEMVETITWSEELGLRLKKIREEQRNLSRNGLTNKIRDAGHEVSPQYIQKLEIGFKSKAGEDQIAQSVGTQTLQAILNALDYSLEQFLEL